MKFNDFIVSEEKVRLDPKCWTGKKIGNPKTKMKGGVRVNNCVPAESVEEAANPAQQAAIAIAKKKKAGVDEAAPPGAKAERMVKHIKKGYAKDGKLSDKEKSIAYATAWKAHNKGVTEAMRPVPVDDKGNRIPDRMSSNAPNRPFGQPGDAKSSSQGVVTYTPTGIVHRSNHGDVTPRPRAVPEDANPNYIWIQGDFDGDTATTGPKQGNWRDQQTTQVELTRGRMSNVRPLSGPPPEGGKTIKQAQIPLTLDAGNQKFSTTGVDLQLTVAPNGYISQGGVGRVRGTAVVKIMRPGNVAEGTQRVDSLVTDALKIMQGSEASDAVAALKTVLGDREYNSRRGYYNFYVRQLMDMSGKQGMAEDYNPEYDDEAGMVENNLETLDRAVEGLDDLINSGDNLPEWCQEKIAVAKSMLVSVWDYMYSEEASDEVDPEVDEMFEAMDQLAEEMARKKGVSVDLVWETFEAMDDHMLYETAAWRRKEGKSAKGGLNAKGVASYRRETPGSKLQTAVTTKPSKLKPGSKAAKRRKSFCARMGGVKGPMKKPNGKPTRKALALRKWNC
jgi:hypothetical protein